MYRPTTRVLAMLELLQSHQRMTGADLARRLEVSVRTARRYVEILQDLGIPVEAERGRYGAYRLRPGFKLPPLMFSEDEALAVTLGLLAVRRLGLGVAAPAIESTLAKIDRVLPLALRDRVEAIQEVLVLHFGVQQVPPASTAVLAFSAAASEMRQVRMSYRSWSGDETERTIDPYGVVYHAGSWYVAGHCHLRGEPRIFRLDRVLSAQVGKDAGSFILPEGFDSLHFVLRSLANTPHALRVVATLDTTLEEARSHIPPSLAALEETPEGVRMTCFTDDPNWMAAVLARLNCDFVVHEPSEVREAVKRLAGRLLMMAEAAGTG